MVKNIWILLFVSFTCYSWFVYSESDPKPKGKPDISVNNGWQVWQDKNCQSCHQIYGLGGFMGPDLTNVASRRNSDYINGILKYGTGRMPDFRLTETEIRDISMFLSWIDKSGNTNVKDNNIHWTGTYIIDN